MSLEQDIARLAAIPTLALLGTEALRLIAFSAETRSFRAGDILFRRGEVADSGFVVLSGAIGVMGPGAADATVASAGTLIGERALIVEVPRPATATAREASSVLKISRRLFYRVLSEFPEGAFRLRRALAADLSRRLEHV